MIYKYQETNHYFAQVASGIEELASHELAAFGAREIRPAHRGIYFGADRAALYRVNYESRVISRVLAPLTKFHCHQTRYLYRKAREIDWLQFFDVGQTFAIFATVSNSKVSHSQYATMVLKDAIVDQFRERTGKRPNVVKINPDVWINLHIANNFATVSWDTSGGSLHRRGYRKESVVAPMQETLAAAILRLSEWDGAQAIYDPFCGSGTLLCEALMLSCDTPAGYLRKRFGFEFLPDFDQQIWKTVRANAKRRMRAVSAGLVTGSDIAPTAAAAAKKNIGTLPFGASVDVQACDFNDIDELENRVIVCNPPYGVRLGNEKSAANLYRSFGDFLKTRCRGSSAYIYFGDRRLIPSIGLKPSWRKPMRSGGLDGRLVKLELY